MQTYKPPSREIRFVLEALGYDRVSSLPRFADFDLDTAMTLVDQVGAFVVDKILPTNKVGDQQGLRWDAETGAVTTPDMFKQVYREFREGGFVGIAGDPAFGGGGAPEMLSIALSEMLSSCNRALAMCPGLSRGLIEALEAHGSEQQQKSYLEKLISGVWSGTMCLTEPQCGTDLGLIKTKAEPEGDHYRLTGTKIWITFGEHDLTDNIIHLVLARLPDAPDGIKGISAFIVPKVTLDGKRNAIKCTGLEHKMGIHGSPTCVIDMEGAEGYLVGEPHKGMRVMFTMMNAARLHVGLEGLAGAEIAYQTALAFAKDRRQSRSLSPSRREKGAAADNILVHPDVRRMLLNQKATNEGIRALAYFTAMQLDLEHHGGDESTRQEAGDLAALLTPVVKAFGTERGVLNISEAMQVCGGSGYTADWNIEQYYRDARITMIYEGTNHIQALDLVGRKLPMHNGRLIQAFAARVKALIEASKDEPKMAPFATQLGKVSKVLSEQTMALLGKAMKDPEEIGAAATNYLRLFAYVAVAFVWCIEVNHALKEDNAFNRVKLKTARYYFDNVLPEYESLVSQIAAGKANMMDFTPEELESA